MKAIRNGLMLGAVAIAAMGAAGSAAHAADAAYTADPAVYKMLFEDANFRVITVTRKRGQRDTGFHSHSGASIIHYLTDCNTKIYGPDNKVLAEQKNKAGTVRAQPAVESHSVETVGPGTCRALIVEKK